MQFPRDRGRPTSNELPTTTRRCSRLCVATFLLSRDTIVRDVQLDDWTSVARPMNRETRPERDRLAL